MVIYRIPFLENSNRVKNIGWFRIRNIHFVDVKYKGKDKLHLIIKHKYSPYKKNIICTHSIRVICYKIYICIRKSNRKYGICGHFNYINSGDLFLALCVFFLGGGWGGGGNKFHAKYWDPLIFIGPKYIVHGTCSTFIYVEIENLNIYC